MENGMMRHYYAFEYKDGINTTQQFRDKYWIAGKLVKFDTKAERDQWVSQGTPYRGDHFRKAVTTRRLPKGWSVKDAELIEP